jgi:hypothetical protein
VEQGGGEEQDDRVADHLAGQLQGRSPRRRTVGQERSQDGGVEREQGAEDIGAPKIDPEADHEKRDGQDHEDDALGDVHGRQGLILHRTLQVYAVTLDFVGLGGEAPVRRDDE